MDSNNLRPAAEIDQPPSMDGDDWRSQLQPESRQRVVNTILETLKRDPPYSGQEGLQELRKIAIRLEEKVYGAAKNQADYLQKISLKLLTRESTKQITLPSNYSADADVNINLHKPGASIEEDVDSCA